MARTVEIDLMKPVKIGGELVDKIEFTELTPKKILKLNLSYKKMLEMDLQQAYECIKEMTDFEGVQLQKMNGSEFTAVLVATSQAFAFFMQSLD